MLVCLRCCSDSVVVLFWFGSVVVLVMVLYCSGEGLIQCWFCFGVVLVLFWCGSGVALMWFWRCSCDGRERFKWKSGSVLVRF